MFLRRFQRAASPRCFHASAFPLMRNSSVEICSSINGSNSESAERIQIKQQLCRTPLLGTSVKKLNMLAHLIKDLPVEQAMLQMMFAKKDDAKDILWALKEGANIAYDIQGIQKEDLYVSWVMCNRGPYTKAITIHGRGRTGRRRTPSAYMVIMLRERKFKELTAKTPKYLTRIPRPNPYKRITNPKIKF